VSSTVLRRAIGFTSGLRHARPRCFQSAYGIDLEARFCAAMRPVIVKSKSRDVWPGALAAALWYVFAKLRDGRLTANASGDFNGDGKPVPPGDIVCIDVVDGR
jgi:hypothetical protein